MLILKLTVQSFFFFFFQGAEWSITTLVASVAAAPAETAAETAATVEPDQKQ